MLNANQLFGEAVKQVYEPDWSGREKFVHLLDVSLHFEKLVNMQGYKKCGPQKTINYTFAELFLPTHYINTYP